MKNGKAWQSELLHILKLNDTIYHANFQGFVIIFFFYLCDFVVRDIKIAVYLESPRKINFNLVLTIYNFDIKTT